jgi:hypothetical protein
MTYKDAIREGLFRKRFAAKRSKGMMTDTSHQLDEANTPQETKSVRAKSSRHGKSTADKWNQ